MSRTRQSFALRNAVAQHVDTLDAAVRDRLAIGRRVVSRHHGGAADALLALRLSAVGASPVLVVTDGLHTLEAVHQDLCVLDAALRTWLPASDDAAGSPALLYLPPRETLRAGEAVDLENMGQRAATLLALATDGHRAPTVCATSVQALMQPAPDPRRLRSEALTLALERDIERDTAVERLVAMGYELTPQVQLRGQITRKGGMLDVWAVNAPEPVRIEFYGPTVDSLRTFDPLTQLSTGKPVQADIAPVSTAGASREHLLAALPPETLVLWCGDAAIDTAADTFAERAREAGEELALAGVDALECQFQERTDLRMWRLTDGADATDPLPFTSLPPPEAGADDVLLADAIRASRERRLRDIARRTRDGETVIVFFDTEGTRHHFDGALPKRTPRLHTRIGTLSGGITLRPGLTLLSESDVYGQKKVRTRPYDPMGSARRPSIDQGDRVADLAALRPGELVVHIEHGLGRYAELVEIEFDGQRQEVISIEYAEGAKLHVPAAHAHLLSRYVGAAGQRVRLHRLGGRRWEREKADAEQAIADMASTLLETQAQRELIEGFAFPPDTPWQRDFEASFPYEETADQAQAILDVKADMEAARPMDRLICGDAGYGKTEVAMRAAFKAVMAGRQVAVLVPTTVLAQQHHRTFTERMAPYPVRVEVLSRFCTRSQHLAIVKDLAAGTIDIIIGTHALVQPGVHFHNLGLAIVDEEQRFGVAHKERLKQIRRLVDVLTLSATPIPRTLYLSLTGSRDMSLLRTPPRERMAIDTQVVRNTDDVVRDAILRELNREGQVFYLHNRVLTIDRADARLKRLVPHARVAVAHGQMPATELKHVMRRFVAGEFDVLLCTTIIESGMDIPSVNTILVDRADRFGIADLYQLRGRVGRSSHKAYALLLIPAHGRLDADARKRIGAIQRHGSLGAGFSLALRDLEIRGSGNLLGAQQSGHIAAIGFGLYCQLLQRTVARLKGEPLKPIVDVNVHLDFLELSPENAEAPNAACLPYDYVRQDAQRMELYRRLAQVAVADDIQALHAELTDRFGRPPEAVQRLLRVAALRVLAHARGLRDVRTREDKLILSRGDDVLTHHARFPRLSKPDASERLDEVARWVSECDVWSKA